MKEEQALPAQPFALYAEGEFERDQLPTQNSHFLPGGSQLFVFVLGFVVLPYHLS